MPRRRALLLVLAPLACTPASVPGDELPWAYRVGESRPAQQANFCVRLEDAEEVAAIFERFGPRTGFSALSASPGCALEVHPVTPRELLRRVRVALDSGEHYDVNFIRVEVAGGEERVLVTTRRLLD